MAIGLKFHSSKLSFLSALNPACSNLVMPFKSSLPETNPPQSLCLSLPLNPLQKIFLLLVTSQALSAHLPTPPASPLHQSILPPYPPMTQISLLQSLLALPNICHPIPLLQWSLLTLSHQFLRSQHSQHCPQPLLHPHPSPPHLHPIHTPIPPPKHTQPIYTHSGRWQELTALSEFMCPFP
jgi:hypothetical protein